MRGNFLKWRIAFCVFLVTYGGVKCVAAESKEKAQLTHAPLVPPPITRTNPAIVQVYMNAGYKTMELAPGFKYTFWTFNGSTPGPMIRARVGDALEVLLSNSDDRGMAHDIDFHAVTGPGGGSAVLGVTLGQIVMAQFKLLHPGLFIYHCAQAPVEDHIANGMYGLILVEPEKPLPKVDREFYVLQSEFYTKPTGQPLEYAPEEGLMEHPRFVVFNGRVGSLNGTNALQVKTGESVRIYFGNAGPNLASSFHVIGAVFDRLYREGDLLSPPARSVAVTLVPAAGTAVVDMLLEVPGKYMLMDHSVFRTKQGATGTINVEGAPRPDIYHSEK
ncbi:MAG: multicopper oxidase domain-containing protein [Limisphaerales bacterium]